MQTLVRRWSAGDLVEVYGAIRRRFWRGSSGPVSRWEVVAAGGRRLAQAPPTVASTARPKQPAGISDAASEGSAPDQAVLAAASS